MRALVAYSTSSSFVQTTLDYLNAFSKYSGFDTDYVHVTHDANIDFEFSSYDIVFHNYCSRLCFEGYVSNHYKERLRRFRGVKILAVQDEYDRTDTLKAAIKDLGFNIVLTCVPQESLEYVYPKAEFPDVKFITVFTGYVSDDFAESHPRPMPLADRPITVGYRGRDIGGKYGRLGFDKFEIGRRMKAICQERGVVEDIAMDEASRIYGMAWFDFLGSCRSMLGSESGSNVFDFDGSIEETYKALTKANGGTPPSYEQFLPVVAKRDGEISMGQISPRVFECALMRTPMVLFRGWYSGAIEPDEHYIALEKDFSNIDEVLTKLEDLPGLEAMTARAYDHLVGSGRFNYRTFFGMVGDEARKRIASPATEMRPVPRAAEGSFKLVNMVPIERPSASPDGLDSLQLRIVLPHIMSLRADVMRLNEAFESQSSTVLSWTEFLIQCAKQQRKAYAEVFRSTGQDGHFSHVVINPMGLNQFIDSSKSEDQEWFSQWKKVEEAIDVNNTEVLLPENYKLLSTAHQMLVDRYKNIGARFTVLGELAAKDDQILSKDRKDQNATALKLAIKNIKTGSNVPRMIRLILGLVKGRAIRTSQSAMNAVQVYVKSIYFWCAFFVPKVSRRLKKLLR